MVEFDLEKLSFGGRSLVILRGLTMYTDGSKSAGSLDFIPSRIKVDLILVISSAFYFLIIFFVFFTKLRGHFFYIFSILVLSMSQVRSLMF